VVVNKAMLELDVSHQPATPPISLYQVPYPNPTP
jgi:hypothetical protein